MANLELFDNQDGTERTPGVTPLAARMRPQTLDDVVGQDHILGPGRLLRRVIEADRVPSLILYGPPGCGKTSLAEVIARVTRSRFVRTSGVLANVSILRERLEEARALRAEKATLLFIDEIHRFNKSQQDVLLPYVEDGSVILIGATTHNPQVFVIGPLSSRSLIFALRSLDEPAVIALCRRALADVENGLGGFPVAVEERALAFLANVCEGDGRRALNALEVAVLSSHPGPDGVVRVDAEIMQDCIQRRMVVYDRDEDAHYDTISAFIKSVRGSDPDAALYWLAKMIHAGEDPRFIARRLLILASEDIGNADPRGLNLAASGVRAVEYIGMPEARIVLGQVTAYLATAPKSNAAYRGISAALQDVEEGRVLAVPEHLKNLHTRADGEEARPRAEYRYPHDAGDGFVDQDYLEAARRYYEPVERGYEAVIAKRLRYWRSRKETNKNEQGGTSPSND